MKKVPATYIMANRYRGVTYVGVTSNLIQRTLQHKNSVYKGFTSRYNVHRLVYYEFHATMWDAIRAEKRLKHGLRCQKVALIECENPSWDDLYPKIIGEDSQC
jgi:putative endonuclease